MISFIVISQLMIGGVVAGIIASGSILDYCIFATMMVVLVVLVVTVVYYTRQRVLSESLESYITRTTDC